MLKSNNAFHQHKYGHQIYCFLWAALAGVIAFVLHELAHFCTAKLLGASNVVFHWGSVEHDISSVSNVGNALIAFDGPIFSYLIIIAAWLYSRNNISVFVLALGFSAAFRGLVLIPFTIRTLLGKDTSTFYFDEIIGANTFGIPPLFPVVVTLIISISGVIYFAHKTKHEGGITYMFVMMAATVAGVFAWSVVGGMVFSGGYGFN